MAWIDLKLKFLQIHGIEEIFPYLMVFIVIVIIIFSISWYLTFYRRKKTVSYSSTRPIPLSKIKELPEYVIGVDIDKISVNRLKVVLVKDGIISGMILVEEGDIYFQIFDSSDNVLLKPEYVSVHEFNFVAPKNDIYTLEFDNLHSLTK